MRQDDEVRWDKLLRIRTGGRDDSNAGQYNYPYEPTPYCVLERLAQSGYLEKNNTLIDYGCGKGRVDFFLARQLRLKAIGIEYDERIYRTAEENRASAASGGRTSFVMANAENYDPPAEADRFYFFNPFSVEILKPVIGRIVQSYYEAPREMYLFFYYPSDEYVSFLMTQEALMFTDEIMTGDLFNEGDARERIMIFEVG